VEESHKAARRSLPKHEAQPASLLVRLLSLPLLPTPTPLCVLYLDTVSVVPGFHAMNGALIGCCQFFGRLPCASFFLFGSVLLELAHRLWMGVFFWCRFLWKKKTRITLHFVLACIQLQ